MQVDDNWCQTGRANNSYNIVCPIITKLKPSYFVLRFIFSFFYRFHAPKRGKHAKLSYTVYSYISIGPWGKYEHCKTVWKPAASKITDILPAVLASLTPDSKVGRGGATLTVSGTFLLLHTISSRRGQPLVCILFLLFFSFVFVVMWLQRHEKRVPFRGNPNTKE